MNRKFKKMFLPAIAAGLLVFGTNGLKESAFYIARADSPYFRSKFQNLSPNQLEDQVRIKNKPSFVGPTMTFLIHGIGSDASAWSNNLRFETDNLESNFGIVGNNGVFAYANDSIVAKIMNRQEETALYVAKPSSNLIDFTLQKYAMQYHNGSTVFVPEENENYLTDSTSHCLVVFDSNNGKQSLANEFTAFENIANRLSFEYRCLHGFIPKVNLIGHSRGGLVAQKYANAYPKNVSSVNTIGTPFEGSNTLSMVEDFSPITSLLGMKEFTLPAYQDINDETSIYELRDGDHGWNNYGNLNNNVMNVASYGSCLTLPFLSRLISITKQNMDLDAFEPIIDSCINVINQINNICSPVSGGANFNDDLISYGSFLQDTDPNQISNLKNSIRSRLNTFFNYELQYAIDTAIDNYAGTEENFLTKLWNIPVVNFLAKFAIKDITDYLKNRYINGIVDSITTYKKRVGVVTNDILVHLESQMSPEYDRYSKLVRVFDADVFTSNYTIHPTYKTFPVGHNLETFDNLITNYIVYESNLRLDTFESSSLTVYATSEIFHFKPTNIGECSQTIAPSVKKYVMDEEEYIVSFKNYLGEGTVDPSISPKITIEERSTPLTISFSSVNAYGGNSGMNNELVPFISYSGSSNFALTIEYNGENRFTYMNNRDTTTVSKGGFYLKNVSVTIKPMEQAISNSSLEICGGNGKNGTTYSGSAANGVTGSDRNGTNGTNGSSGGVGYRGWPAIKCKSLDVTEAINLTLQGGKGGNGGNGQNGGNGGNGKSKSMGYKGGNGGDGGKGGQGGIGGDGGYAVDASTLNVGTNFVTNNVKLYSGNPGNGGNGGKGGNGGNGANGSYVWVIFKGNVDYGGGNGGKGGVVGNGSHAGMSSITSATSSDHFFESKYDSLRNSWTKRKSNGGLCGSSFGNGGNAGCGSRNKTSLDGKPGKAVTGPYTFNNCYPSYITSLYSSDYTGSYFNLNGYGWDDNFNYVHPTKQPTYGKCGSVVYNYDE